MRWAFAPESKKVKQSLFPILKFCMRYMELSEISEKMFSSWHSTCSPVLESNVGAGGKMFAPWLDSRKLSELSFVSEVWNIKFTATWILESTIVVPSFLIYFSSSLFSSANGALESLCSCRLQKKFDTTHEAQTVEKFSTGTNLMLMVSQRAGELQSRRGVPQFVNRPWHNMECSLSFTARTITFLLQYLVCRFNHLFYCSILYFFQDRVRSWALGCVSFKDTLFKNLKDTLLKQLKVLIPTGLLKSRPAIVISQTQRSYSDVGSNLTRLLNVLLDSKQASNSDLLI